MYTAATSDRRRLAVLLLAACISSAALALLGLRARADAVFPWDPRIQAWLTSYAEPDEFNATADDVIGLLLTIGADLTTVTVVLAAVTVLIVGRRFRDSCFLLASVGGAIVLTYLLKDVFGRDPLTPYGKYELPSGHATRSLVVAGALLALTWSTRWRWRTAIASALFVATVGASLVYEDWHLPSDVLAGWALGLAVLTAVGAVFLTRAGVAVTATVTRCRPGRGGGQR